MTCAPRGNCLKALEKLFESLGETSDASWENEW